MMLQPPGRKVHRTAKIYGSAILTDRVTTLEMAENSFVGDLTFISVPTLILGKGAQVNSGTRIVGRKPVQIGDYSTIGYGCTLITSSDSTEARYMNDAVDVDHRILREGPIGIGDKSFIGSHSICMPSVNIVSGVVVRAFSYVNRSLTIPHSIYGGMPAVLLKERGYVKSADT